MGIVKERVAAPNFDSLLPTLKRPKEIKDILVKNKITADDKLRPMLMCVYFDEKGIAVATDSHKMVCVKYDATDKQFKPFEGKCIESRMGVDYNEKLGGSVIEGRYPNYPAVFPKEAEYSAEIEITKGLLSFLKKYSSNKDALYNKFYIKQGDFEILLSTSNLYRLLKALYELGETKITAYAIDDNRSVVLVGKTTSSILMPMFLGKGHQYEGATETFSVVEKDGVTDLVVTDFDSFQRNFLEGKYGVTADKKEIKPLSENDLFIDTNRDMFYVSKYEGFTSVSDAICAWIERGEGGMGVEGLVDSCKEVTMPKFLIEKPEKLYELNIKDFVKGFEDYYKAHLERQEENYYKGFLERINEEHQNDGKVYIPKDYKELTKVWKEGFYSMFLPNVEKPQRYTFVKADGTNEQCLVGINIDDKTMWQTPQNLKKMLGVFTKLGYDIVYAGMVFQEKTPIFYFESTDERYCLIIMPYKNDHTGENRDYIKKFGGSGVSYTEVQSEISNFDVMLKMFEENGIQTEFVDTNEKIIERLKKEGHSDENINFSLQEDFELDDEDDEPKQGTLNLSFEDYQTAKKIAKDVHNHWIDEHKGSANAYNDIVKQIENYQEAGYTDEMIVSNILDHAKRWYRWNEKQMFDEIEKIPETTRSAYLTITKKDEGDDKE